MQQSRLMSLAESVTNVVIGYVLAIATQIVVFPWFGIETGLAEHMTIGLAFVGVSLAGIAQRLGVMNHGLAGLGLDLDDWGRDG